MKLLITTIIVLLTIQLNAQKDNSNIQEVRFTIQGNTSLNQQITQFDELELVVSQGVRFNFLGVRFITVGYSF